ncbi:DHA2 family efflux MFS transporter permease subunit [Lactococcus hircilactis]|uniref:DHA2 family efflux MFS transporter permease subunit n=1 Tax=Lactococcus hircilactis TaxID=1494462 RepID=A0A7X2D276_9LACT|nr:MFS transporter [Lactococcus hircilactis]MQW40192.1 DHA2 family efflux MFS transporter permease subunit [Lactococcus hircilactis]
MANRTKALLAIGIFTFMSTLDGSIVNIALPTMSRELHTSTAQITWVVTIYLIVISAIILIFGRLSDLIGKAKVTKIGWGIFILGSFLAGLNLGMGLAFLLVARVIQAIGASMMMATSFGIIAQIFPAENRARALAINTMFVSVGSIAGPALGGVILQIASWNYIFWINVPIGILAWIFGNRALPTRNGQGQLSDIDLKGGALMSGVIILLFLALNFGMTLGWTNPLILIAVLLGILLFIAFIVTEKRSENPLLNLGIFKSKLFSLSLIMALFNFTVSMFASILLPFYLQDYRAFGPGIAGMFMMCYPLSMLIFSPIAGIIADKIDKELVTFIGISGIVISQIGYLMIHQTTPSWWIVLVLLIQGGSVGIFQSPNNALIMETVDRKYLGIAGSVNSLARNVAFVLGTSLATIILFFSMSKMTGQKVTSYLPDQPEIFLNGMHVAFIFALCFTLITWILALSRLLGRKKIQA